MPPKTPLLLLLALLAVLALGGCGTPSNTAALTPTPTLSPQATAVGNTLMTILLVVVWIALGGNILIEIYNGLVKKDVYYPLGYLVGGAIGYGIAYLLGYRGDEASFFAVVGWYLGSRLIHFRATGVFARAVGVFWILVLIGFLFITWGLLFNP